MGKYYRIPAIDLRRYLYRSQFGICVYCFRPVAMDPARCREDDYATVEHIVSSRNGGSFTPDNLACACQRCNNRKGDRTALAFILSLNL